MLLALLFACTAISPRLPGDGADPFHEGAPAIASLSLECATESAAWTLDVETDAWTGGGTLWMAKDLTRVEAHPVRSAGAASDGSWDTLALTLSIVFDWRDASSGSTSGWRCEDEAALSFQVGVKSTDGVTWTDCRTWGVSPDLWSTTEDVPDCDTLHVVEADTGAPDTGGAGEN